jgi:thymidylate synthase (FAD)
MTLAKIIAITQPLVREETNGGELQQLSISEFVAYCARVSNPSNQSNNLTASKLLKYLAKHKHWSPFEMVNVVMEIETTRDIARQILRHRSFSFQEFSQRYADPTKDLGFVIRETRLQDTKNRQNSLITDDEKLQHVWEELQTDAKNRAINAYTWAISNGIAKEQARSVLPEGLTISRMYMNGTLRSWIHYCLLRMANGTQKEHQLIAKKCWDNILVYFPDLNNIVLE